ncbi:nucleotide triphosphate diphosphatase NUDT15-like [Ptychodera flava]|uniref:nucleotide triphosphate diphosphatase NUDT15-like n=1 Tax=Ptychodera flava TaxID=63121 RepID=UPI003969D6AE
MAVVSAAAMSNGNFHDVNMRPKVGVGVVVTSCQHPDCILIGRRRGKITGAGLYALPGGHLEFGESWEECARRETLEETGLSLKDVCFSFVINAVMEEKDYHYITLFMSAEIDATKEPEPLNMEPEKCEGWEWVKWDDFPPDSQLFHPLLVARQRGFDPFQTLRENSSRI